MVKRAEGSGRGRVADDDPFDVHGDALLADDAPIVWHGPAAAVGRRPAGHEAIEAELEAALEYILALQGEAGVDRIFAIVTRTIARRGTRRPS